MVEFLTTPTNLFNITVTHLRIFYTKDEGGSTVENLTTIGTFNCRIQGPPAEETEGHETGHRSFYKAVLYCGPNEDIREDDKIKQSATVTWDVSGIDNVGSENIYKAVNIKRSI